MKPSDVSQKSWDEAWRLISEIQREDMKAIPKDWDTFMSTERLARALDRARSRSGGEEDVR